VQLYRQKKTDEKQALHLQFSEIKRESADSFDSIKHETDAAGPLTRSCLRQAGDPRVLLRTDERAASCLLCFGSIQQLQLRKSYLVRFQKSPGPDRDPVGALFLLPLPLLLRLPGLLRPLLPRLVDLDLLLPALLAAEGHVTSAIGKETLISQTIPSLRCEIFQEKKRPIEC
jgi:hypothetical protein